MSHFKPVNPLRLAILALFVHWTGAVWSQSVAPTNSLPNPYRGIPFGKLPDGRQWGSTAGIDVDRDGKNIWVFERCGGPKRVMKYSRR
jgi:hypothetical protein